ncbi:MAG: nuclear transport factor 2 family protein [Bacteroidota bacterium]
MRNRYLSGVLFALLVSVNAQDKDNEAVTQIITSFFKAFHNKDSLGMKPFMADEVVLQTTGRDQEGNTRFHTQPVDQFYESLAGIPDSIVFEEKLLSWNVKVDRTIANAWVGYEFWWNGNFSHCGINSFQLVNFNGEWKIVYLIDTRGRAGCDPKQPQG